MPVKRLSRVNHTDFSELGPARCAAGKISTLFDQVQPSGPGYRPSNSSRLFATPRGHVCPAPAIQYHGHRRHEGGIWPTTCLSSSNAHANAQSKLASNTTSSRRILEIVKSFADIPGKQDKVGRFVKLWPQLGRLKVEVRGHEDLDRFLLRGGHRLRTLSVCSSRRPGPSARPRQGVPGRGSIRLAKRQPAAQARRRRGAAPRSGQGRARRRAP